jgi:predicted  nucleic acid-binding Zn-ribbon protein
MSADILGIFISYASMAIGIYAIIELFLFFMSVPSLFKNMPGGGGGSGGTGHNNVSSENIRNIVREEISPVLDICNQLSNRMDIITNTLAQIQNKQNLISTEISRFFTALTDLKNQILSGQQNIKNEILDSVRNIGSELRTAIQEQGNSVREVLFNNLKEIKRSIGQGAGATIRELRNLKEKFSEEFTNLSETQKAFLDEINNKYSAIILHYTELRDFLSKIDSNFSEIKDKLSRQENNLDDILILVRDIQSRSTSMERLLGNLQNNVSSIKETVNRNEGMLKEIIEKIKQRKGSGGGNRGSVQSAGKARFYLELRGKDIPIQEGSGVENTVKINGGDIKDQLTIRLKNIGDGGEIYWRAKSNDCLFLIHEDKKSFVQEGFLSTETLSEIGLVINPEKKSNAQQGLVVIRAKRGKTHWSNHKDFPKESTHNIFLRFNIPN